MHGTSSPYPAPSWLTRSPVTSEEGEDDEVLEILSPKLKSFKEAMSALEDDQNFLESRSCSEDATMAAMLIDNLATQHASSAKQTSLFITSSFSSCLYTI